MRSSEANSTLGGPAPAERGDPISEGVARYRVGIEHHHRAVLDGEADPKRAVRTRASPHDRTARGGGDGARRVVGVEVQAESEAARWRSAGRREPGGRAWCGCSRRTSRATFSARGVGFVDVLLDQISAAPINLWNL